jgi:SOS response regulatory protein OraA/RecX
MLIHAQRSFLLILLVALSACQQLGLVQPQTFTEQLAYSYSQNAAIRKSAADALNAKTISKSDAQQVLTTTDTVRAALDEAKALSGKGGDTSTALGKLQLAQGLLQTVQAFLASRGVK